MCKKRSLEQQTFFLEVVLYPLFLFLGMIAIFYFSIPFTKVDRVQETWYLGVPYWRMIHGGVWIDKIDPFPENSPLIVIAAGKVLQKTGSLLALRWALASFSFANMLLMYGMFRAWQPAFSRDSLRGIWVPVLFLAAWVSIVQIISYPIQTNGMSAGFLFFVAGLFLYRRSRVLALLAFGFAYSCKGQFLGFFPGILLYEGVFREQASTFPQRLWAVISATFLLFAPAMLVITFICWALGLFRSITAMLEFAVQGPSLFAGELGGVLAKLLGKSAVEGAELAAIDRRAYEFAGFGILVWAQIAFSFLFCLFWAARTGLVAFVRNDRYRVNPALAILGLSGAGYWLSYLFFNRYPYWYNTLAIVPLNVFILSYLVANAGKFAKARFGAGGARFILIAALIASSALLFVRSRSLFSAGVGDALASYPWMEPGYEAHPHWLQEI